MKTHPEDLYDLIRLVRPLYKGLEAAVSRRLEGTGLSVTGRAVLEQLHDRGPLPVPRIADALMLPRQFVQKTADTLTAEGLVERRHNPVHRRSALIAPTPAGEALIARVLAAEAEVTHAVAARLSPDQIAVARAVIQTMIDGYAEDAENDDH